MTSVCGIIRREIFDCRRVNALTRKVNYSILRKENSTFVLKRRHSNANELDTTSYMLNPNCHACYCESKSLHVKFRCISGAASKMPIVYLFTKEGCTLCDEAKLALTPYKHRFILEEVDITLPENEQWYEMYKYEIPVFHMFEDFLFKHQVNFDVLEQALKDFEEKRDRT